MNRLTKKLKDSYVTKVSDGLYFFENRDVKALIGRNDRYRDWDVYWTDESKEPNPDRYTHNEETLRSAIMDCYRQSIGGLNNAN